MRFVSALYSQLLWGDVASNNIDFYKYSNDRMNMIGKFWCTDMKHFFLGKTAVNKTF